MRPDYWIASGEVPFEWNGGEDRRQGPLAGRITLPFPPESEASGFGESRLEGTLWYSIDLPRDAVTQALDKVQRLLVHFEAVWGAARVWVDGHLAGGLTARYSRSTVDLTPFLAETSTTLVLEVAVDHADMTEPRGKQDWLPRAHGIWYKRSSGIWRDVWFEVVSAIHVTDVVPVTDLDAGDIVIDVRLSRRVDADLSVVVSLDGAQLGRTTVAVMGSSARVVVHVAALENEHARGELLWSTESPTLLDLRVELMGHDSVLSYTGAREVGTTGGRFTLNHHPEYLNAVLEQYYWPQTHYTAPSDDARRAEVELVRALGLNAVRVHQVSPDPRFLYWCDRLGLLVWGELPSAYRFDAATRDNVTREWTAIVRQASPHPSVVTWVPFNESWGIPAVERDARQQAFVLALVSLTRALDQTRPVISNDGWEHVDSDILGFHDYTQEGEALAARFRDESWARLDAHDYGVAGRRGVVSSHQSAGVPVMLSEFGGVTYDVASTEGAWGYGTVTDATGYEARVRELVGAARSVTTLAGTCYTQLTDTLQEANGLTDENRVPKLPLATLREILGT